MLLTHEDLHEITINDAGNATGLRRRWKWIRSQSADVDPLELANALTETRELTSIIGGLGIAAEMRAPEFPQRSALADALIGLVSDERTLEWQWGAKNYQSKSFGVAQLAVEALVALLQRERNRPNNTLPTDDLPRIDVAATLIRCLQTALGNRAGSQALRTLMKGFRQLPSTAAGREAIATSLADGLERAAADPGRLATLRWMALEELALAAKGPGKPEPAFERAWIRAVASMADALADDGTDFRYTKLAEKRLAKVAPTKVDEIQRAGKIPIIALPQPEEVVTAWGRPAEDFIDDLVSKVATESVQKALVADETGSPRDRLAAACMAPALAERVPWHEVASWLFAAALHLGSVPIPRPRAATPLTIDVGAFCLDRAVRVVSRNVRHKEHCMDLVLRWLDPLLDAQRPRGREYPASFARLLAVVHNGGFSEQARSDMTALLLECAKDTTRSSAARFAALRALKGTAEAVRVAWSILAESTDSPSLRASIGASINEWDAAGLGKLVDDTSDRWVPLSTASSNLPISQPGRAVPTCWLLATLEASADPAVVHSTIRELGVRLDPHDQAKVSIASLLRAALTEKMVDKLREVVAKSGDRGIPRWSAAMLLGTRGGAEDEDRLVAFAVERGAWTQVDPCADDFEDRDLLEHMTLDPLSYENPRHLLEPYFRAGYGEEHTKRLMAKIFVKLGRAARQRGYLFKAQNAFRQAQHLDPLNLDAHRDRVQLPSR